MNVESLLNQLLDRLWTQYKKRVSYAAQYEKMVEEKGGHALNDHIAFRTFNTKVGSQPAGTAALSRIFEPLGYQRKDCYVFKDKKLTAWHWQHKTNPNNPKLFISQLEVDQLSQPSRDAIAKTIGAAPDLISASDLSLLAELGKGKEIGAKDAEVLTAHLVKFFGRPWAPPQKKIIQDINKESQYAAWTLLHGNSVNHFTAYINEQKVKEWPDIEATVAALRNAGLPMKPEFEGERGTKLRQSSTQAVDEDCDVIDENGKPGKLKWSYAYYELAERGNVPGPDGKPTRFHAFLGEQATNLFEMTKRG
jgi:Domain of unknown function (DUF1338)